MLEALELPGAAQKPASPKQPCRYRQGQAGGGGGAVSSSGLSQSPPTLLQYQPRFPPHRWDLGGPGRADTGWDHGRDLNPPPRASLLLPHGPCRGHGGVGYRWGFGGWGGGCRQPPGRDREPPQPPAGAYRGSVGVGTASASSPPPPRRDPLRAVGPSRQARQRCPGREYPAVAAPEGPPPTTGGGQSPPPALRYREREGGGGE